MVVGKLNKEEKWMRKSVEILMRGGDPIKVLEKECNKCLANCRDCKLNSIIENLANYLARLEMK